MTTPHLCGHDHRRTDDMFDAINRILSGQALTRRQRTGAGIFVAVWFLMDLIQFVDWLLSKFH
jgi:hypothetical protein